MLGVSSNLSIDTDPQQQEAASPLMLVVRSFLRKHYKERVKHNWHWQATGQGAATKPIEAWCCD